MHPSRRLAQLSLPTWAWAIVGIVLALGFLAAAGPAQAAIDQHGVGFTKGCTSPISVGQAISCTSSVQNLPSIDTAQDTLQLNSYFDCVKGTANGGPPPTGCTAGATMVTAFTISGVTHTNPGTTCTNGGALPCNLGSGDTLVIGSAGYTAQPVDAGNVISDQAVLNWTDLCTSHSQNCPIGPQYSTSASQTVVRGAPSISTTLSGGGQSGANINVPLGTSVTDQATLSGATSTAGGTVTYNVYPSAANCTGPALFSSTKTVTNGSVPASDSFTPAGVGGYNVQASYSGDANNDPVTSTCTAETLTILARTLIITTSLSGGGQGGPSISVPVGTSVTDQATLSGATSTAGGTVTYNVYPSSANCTGPALFSSTVTVTNGSVPPSTPFTPASAGSYNVQASYSGDLSNGAVASTCTSEVLTVQPRTPTISTTLSGGGQSGSSITVSVGTSVTDQATLSGATSTAGGTVTYNVYPSAANCTGPALFSSTKTVTNGVAGASDPFSPAVGTYNVQVSYSGDANNAAVTSTCTAEVLTVQRPPISVSTTLTGGGQTGASISVALGTSVTDQATLSGATPTAGGTVTYNVYPSAANCTGPALFSSTVTVTNGSVPPSTPFTPASAGAYNVQASYSGDANNAPATSVCTAETVVVQSPLTPCLNIHKDVDKTTANIGDTVTYTLTITDNVNPGGALAGFPCTDAVNPSLDDVADNNVSFTVGTLTVTPTSAFSCTISSGDVNCTSGVLHTTDTVVITFKAKLTGCGSTSNFVTFTAQNFITMLPPFFFSQHGKSNGVVTTINCPDLTISKTLAPDTNVPALIGGTVHYQIVVKNQGLAPAKGVTITDPIPAGYAFAAATIGTATPPPANAFSPCYFGSTNDLPAAHAAPDGDADDGAICGGQTPPAPSTLNTLGPGQSVTVDLYLTVNGCQLAPNTATVTGTTQESDFNGVTDANNSSTAPAPSVKCPNLTISKTAQDATGAPITTILSGGTYTYAITVKNTGNAAVQPTGPAEPPIYVTDLLPASLGIISGPAGKVPTDWDCSFSVGNNIACKWIGMGAGGTGGLDINATTSPILVTVQAPSLNPGQAPLSICNTAAVNGRVTPSGTFAAFGTQDGGGIGTGNLHATPVPETTYSDNISQVCVTVTPPSAAPEPIPSLTKTADKSSAATGDFVTYTLTAGNTGNQDMTNVTITDQLPANVSLQNPPGITVAPSGTGFTCSFAPAAPPPGQLITCSGGTVKANSTVTITFVVEVNACPDIVNQATITHYEDRDDDAQDADDAPVLSNKVTVTVTSCPKLTINKQGPSTVPNTNSQVAYVVTVTNTGPVGATNVTLKDVIGPASEISTFWSINPSPGTCSTPVLDGSTPPNDVISCNLGNIAPNGGTATLSMLVQLSGGSFCSITNTATASGSINGVTVNAAPAPTATSNTVVTTTPCPDVSIVKTFDHSDSGTGFGATGIVPDTHAIWHIVVTNNSTTVQALGVEVTDVFDRPSDFATLSTTPGAPTCVSNLNTNETANKANTLTNIDCHLGTLAPGASVTITVDALTKSAPAFCAVNDTATVTTTNGNLSTATSSTAGPTPVLCTSLALTKKVTQVNGAAPSGTPVQVRPGDTVTYEIDVTNPSTSTVSSLTVTDKLVAGLTYVAGSATPGGAFAGLDCSGSTPTQVNCKNGTLPGTTTGTVTFKATVGTSSAVCGTLNNVASASGTNIFQQTVSADNSASPTALTVLCPNLQTKKQLADGNGHVITPPVAVAGTNAPYHYLITVVNNGNLATPVTVTDKLPVGEDVNCPSLPIGSCLPGPFSSTSPFGTWSCTVAGVPPAQETVTCTLSGGLPQGGVVVLDIPISFGGPSRTDTNCADVTVPAGTVLTSDSVTHACVTVEVHSNDFHPTVGIAKTCADTTTQGTAGIAITANFGDTVTCTLTVTNTGNAPADMVTVTDTTPTGLTMVGKPVGAGGTTPPNCTASTASQVNCSGGSLASNGNPGASLTVTVTYTVSGCSPITNTATTSAETDVNQPGESASATITPQCAKLSVTKSQPYTLDGSTHVPVTAIDTSHGPVQHVLYDIAVSNTGAGHTVNLKLSDVLPPGATYDNSTTTSTPAFAFSCSGTTTVTCTTGAGFPNGLPATKTWTLHLEVTYAYPTSCPTSVTNSATANDDSGATATGSNQPTPVYCADLAVASGPGNANGANGFGMFSQNFNVTNTGTTAAATNVKFHLDIAEPTGLRGTLSSVTATNGGTCTFSSTTTSMTADCTWASVPAGQINGVSLIGFYTKTPPTASTSFTMTGSASADNVAPDAHIAEAAGFPVGTPIGDGDDRTDVTLAAS